MKILIVTSIYPPDIGGPAKFVKEFSTFCKNVGEEVSVFTLSDGKIIGENSVYSVKRTGHTLARMIKTIIALVPLIAWADVVLVNGLQVEFVLANMFTKKKSIAKIVGDPIWERARNKNRTNANFEDYQNNIGHTFKDRILLRVWSAAIKRFECVISPSYELITMVKTKWGYSKKTRMIRNGVPCVSKVRDLELRNIEVVTVSRLVNWKQIDILIEGSAKYGYMLTIVGDGPQEKSLRRLSDSLGAQVIFTGRKSSEEVNQILSNSKIFALASNYEGMSFALLEAMAFGLVPIVSSVQGNKEVIRDGISGILVEENEDFGFVINKTLHDQTLMNQISEKSKIEIQSYYCEEKVFSEYLEELHAIS